MKNDWMKKSRAVVILAVFGVFLSSGPIFSEDKTNIVVTPGQEASSSKPNNENNKENKLSESIAKEVKLVFHPPMPLLKPE